MRLFIIVPILLLTASSFAAPTSCSELGIDFHGLFMFSRFQTNKYITVKEYRKIGKELTIHSDFYDSVFAKTKEKSLKNHSVKVFLGKQISSHDLVAVDKYWLIDNFNFRKFLGDQEKINFDFKIVVLKQSNAICETHFLFRGSGD